jgi:ferredoxin
MERRQEMSEIKPNAFIVFLSPSGTTRHVAGVIEQKLIELKWVVNVYDLSISKAGETALKEIKALDGNFCLYIGSPVYVSHAVAPVMDFISGLPEESNGYAVPFATWGGASSGVALYEMTAALGEKHIQVPAAIRVLAVHSMMWDLDEPLGRGHPDEEDDRLVREMVERVENKIQDENGREISLSQLKYHPDGVWAEMEKVTLDKAKQVLPGHELDENLCTQCDICKEGCPTDSITLSPFPEIGPDCIYCLNCVRECPEEAMKVNLEPVYERIRARAKQCTEDPPTHYFI